MSAASSALRRTIVILAALAALLILCLAFIVSRSWKASRQALGTLAAVSRVESPVLDAANKREQLRDAVLTKDLARISREERAANNSMEIVKRLPEAFSALPQPVVAAFAPQSAGDNSADPPAIITVPQADLKPLFDQLEACRACQEELATAQQDLNDERAKFSAVTVERDAAIKAARGGGFWPRFRIGVKWFAIGAAAGALAASAAHR